MSDNLDRDIAQRRQRLAELGSAQRREEHAFGDLRAQAELLRAAIKRNREQLIGDSRERTTLLGELDQLLQRRVHRDNAALAEAGQPEAGDVMATDIMELNRGVPPPLATTPTGTSEWRLGVVPPPRPHAGPPPTAPALAGPRAPEPPSHLAVAPGVQPIHEVPRSDEDEGDGITQVTSRAAAMRSAAFQTQARPLGPPPVKSAPRAATGAPHPAVPSAPARRQVAMAVEVELGGVGAAVGFSERLSEAGIVVAADSARRVGDRVPIQFTLPGHHRAIACDAEVAQVTHSVTAGGATRGLLLRFLTLSAHDRAALARFIVQREASRA